MGPVTLLIGGKTTTVLEHFHITVTHDFYSCAMGGGLDRHYITIQIYSLVDDTFMLYVHERVIGGAEWERFTTHKTLADALKVIRTQISVTAEDKVIDAIIDHCGVTHKLRIS